MKARASIVSFVARHGRSRRLFQFERRLVVDRGAGGDGRGRDERCRHHDGDDRRADDGGADHGAPTTAAAAPLRIMVTNDDGVAGEGISVLVDALAKVPNVEVDVIAPKDDKSGSGDTVTPGPLTATDAALVGGHPAKAVDGFPADTVIYGVRAGRLGAEAEPRRLRHQQGSEHRPGHPALGTVGAALTAAKAGVPAVAVSQQTLKDPAPVPPDYSDRGATGRRLDRPEPRRDRRRHPHARRLQPQRADVPGRQGAAASPR